MTRYGVSDPRALAEATRLARRSGIGFAVAMMLCGAARSVDPNLVAAQAFALAFTYIFLSIALMTAGRRRMLVSTVSTGTLSRIITIAMIGGGSVMLLGSSMTLVTLVGMALGLVIA